MTTALDTNIIVGLWDTDNALNARVQSALDTALGHGNLIVAAPVFAELLAFPGRDEPFLDSFFNDTGIQIDWDLNEAVWRIAGRAFQTYAGRRRKHRESGPRRILADFLIGAHAVEKGCRLLTLDDRLFRAAFPQLRILRAV
jgi:predicted nucleic acid-binding protein